MLDTVIRNLKVLRAGVWTAVDVGIESGKIAEITSQVTGSARSEVIAEGQFAMSGAVDLHVHFNEPGRTNWEGFKTGSAAAAAGGVTTVAEMPLNSIPSTVTVDALDQKLAAIKGKSSVDYALWGGVVPGNVDSLEALADAGVVGFKAFMSPSGTDDFDNSDVATLREAMRRIARTGLRLALHAEDPHVLKAAEAKLGQKETALDWEASRPVSAEVSAVQIAIELSVETGCPITIVHVSSPEVLAVIDAAKAKGVDILAETCPHYLLLNIGQADAIGPVAKCAPPLRSEATVSELRAAVLSGRIDTIGSDHSPSSPDLKEGLSFYKAWGGISGLQHGLPLTLDMLGMDLGLTGQCLEGVFSAKPASVAGMSAKGQLTVGADADLVLFEQREMPAMIQKSDLLYRHPFSAYIGCSSRVVVASTWLRGVCIYKEGAILSAPTGRFINCAELRK
jgi:allantoinase